MNENQSIYNNELIGLISIVSVLSFQKKMNLSKIMLILPFFSHNSSMKVLKSKNVKIRSLEEFIIKYPSYFSNFDERFLSLLSISFNSLVLLKRMEIISVNDGEVLLLEKNKFNLHDKELGKRAKEITLGAEKLSNILNADTENLYLQLRVKL